MNKPIHSYEDLLKERRRLEVLLQAQKQLIHHDVQQLKAQLQLVTDAVDFIKKITTRDKTSLLLNIGSDIVINSVVKRVILSRAGWFVRTVIPYFLKNFSSHILAEQKEKWFDKLAAWIGHKNGKEHQNEKETSEGESTKEDV